VTCARGPSSEADLARGGVQLCRSGGPRGLPGVWSFSACVFRLVN
jgi:hypothetical protein